MLVGDIIDVARIETERLVLRPERASIRPLLESIVTMMDGLARQNRCVFPVKSTPTSMAMCWSIRCGLSKS